MAIPTPVSALVHSSTLVTIGVYLTIRLNFIFCGSNTNILLFMGIITILLARAAAIFEIDIIKVIGLSTSTELGAIIIIVGTLEATLSFFHLLMYVLIKIILFTSIMTFFFYEENSLKLRKVRIIFNFTPVILSLTVALDLGPQVLWF